MSEREQFEVEFAKLGHQWSEENKDKAFLGWRMARAQVTSLAEQQIEASCEAVAVALGDAYDCTRVWSAWSYGTMGPEDFSQVSEDGDRVREIALAALGAAGLKVAP